MDQTRLLLVDDHVALRQALALMLEREPGFVVASQASTLAEARQMLVGIDLAIVDLGLPDGSGTDLIGALHAVNPGARVLVLTASLNRLEIARAVEAAAAGVLHKSVTVDEIVAAVRRLTAGETLVSLSEVIELLRFAGQQREQEYRGRQAIEQLTIREREVLQALADGLDSEDIAQRLNIRVHTERTHMMRILAKFGVHSRLQALVFAARHGLVSFS